jgi:hypothetical protein
MATSNFHNVNASHIFACSLENEWDFEDLKDNLFYEFKNLDGFDSNTKSDPHELRSFPSNSICSISRQHIYKNFSLDVIVTIVARSGYYEGCNLDWHVSYEIDGHTADEDDFFSPIDYVYSNFVDEYVETEVKGFSLLAEKKAEELKNEIVEEVEKVFSMYSDKLGVTAQFSNGETIYHKIA